MTNNKDTRRGGFYFKDGIPYLSTTTILQIIAKPALAYWYGKEVFYAMVQDPTIDEKTAMAAPYNSSRKAMSTGTTVHSIVEAYKTTGEELEGIPDDFKLYATAFYKFMKDHKVEIIEQEKTIFDPEHKVAGTLDMYAKIGDSLHILDIKTGKDIYNEVSLQLSSYSHMMRLENKKVDSISVLLLEKGDDGLPTGNYKFAIQTENHEAFLAAKQLYEWNNKEKLLKAGYLK